MILITDFQLLVAAGSFCVIMIALSALGYRAHRRQQKRLRLEAVRAELNQRIADQQAAPTVILHPYTVTQIRAAADTNSRRAHARGTKKGSTHE